MVQSQLPLPPLAADQVPPALVMGSDTDPLVDVTDVEVGPSAACSLCLAVARFHAFSPVVLSGVFKFPLLHLSG